MTSLPRSNWARKLTFEISLNRIKMQIQGFESIFAVYVHMYAHLWLLVWGLRGVTRVISSILENFIPSVAFIRLRLKNILAVIIGIRNPYFLDFHFHLGIPHLFLFLKISKKWKIFRNSLCASVSCMIISACIGKLLRYLSAIWVIFSIRSCSIIGEDHKPRWFLL